MSKSKENIIRLISLGGVDELGKNMYLVEVNDDIFVVDAGLMFPEDEMLGIDTVIPDITYLRENKHRVKAIFLTHGHEDHIGALEYILPELRVPVYGSELTLALVKYKLANSKKTIKANLNEINSDSILKFNNITVRFFQTTHSIPGSLGISIDTPDGSIVHTGDFKFDQATTDLYKSDIGKMDQIGESGVLCLLSDSTGAEDLGYSTSEAVVFQQTCKAMDDAKGRVIAVCFASDINRMQHIFHAAKQNNRKVAVIGESLQRIYEIAHRLSYLQIADDLIIDVNDLKKYRDDEVVILATGIRGEPIEVLQRMALKRHQQVNIKRGDSIFFAASPVKGSELLVAKTIDLVYRAGGTVFTRDVHVSSHGSAEDLKLMINLMKPKFFIPVHGEHRMLRAHANIAKLRGIPEDRIVIPDNGEVVEIKGGKMRSVGRVPSGNVLIDGYGVGDVGNIVLRDRRLLSQDGILITVVTLSRSKKSIVSGPEIISRGFVYVRESEKLIDESTRIVRDIIEKNIANDNFDWTHLKQEVRDALNSYLFQKTRRRPMILPILMEV